MIKGYSQWHDDFNDVDDHGIYFVVINLTNTVKISTNSLVNLGPKNFVKRLCLGNKLQTSCYHNFSYIYFGYSGQDNISNEKIILNYISINPKDKAFFGLSQLNYWNVW